MSEKTNGKRNYHAGHKWERDIIAKLDKIGYKNLITSREGSRARDKKKVDIMSSDEDRYGRFKYNIQAKTLAKTAPYHKMLEEMPDDGQAINVIFHKQTKRNPEGKNFMKQGAYAILDLEDFYSIMQRQLELEDEVKSWNNLM